MQPYRPSPKPGTYRPEPGAAQPEPQPAPKPACFRISGIPHSWNSSERLEVALQTIDPDFDPTAAEVSGPFPDSYGSSTQTALLNLSKCTSYFTFEPSQEKHEVISENGRKVHLVLDKHFYDLTPLNRAEEPIKIELVNLQIGFFSIANMLMHSVIAITGLGGHAFGAWQSRISAERPIDRPMWLRDFLPREFPNARIMTYGYHSSPTEPSSANMTDYRRGFIQCLQNSRRECPVSFCLTKLLLIMLTIFLCYAEAPHCLYRAQSGRDPGCSGKGISQINSYPTATQTLITAVNGSRP